LGRDEAVSQHAAGLRHAIDFIADVGHLLRRHHRFLGIRPGRGRDEPDRRLAIEEDLLHKILPREISHGAAVDRKLRVHPLGPLAQPQQCLLRDGSLAPGLCIVRVIPSADVMDLHVEDEVGLTRALPQRRRIGGFNREDLEEPAEDRVHGEQRQRHPAAAPQEGAAAEPEPRCQTLRFREDALLHLLLGGGLRVRREFFVGDEPGGQRHLGAQAPAHLGTDTEGMMIRHSHD
jgi:hypothetical protein